MYFSSSLTLHLCLSRSFLLFFLSLSRTGLETKSGDALTSETDDESGVNLTALPLDRIEVPRAKKKKKEAQ